MNDTAFTPETNQEAVGDAQIVRQVEQATNIVNEATARIDAATRRARQAAEELTGACPAVDGDGREQPDCLFSATANLHSAISHLEDELARL